MNKNYASERFKEVRNAKAHRDFFIEDKFEAGIMLTGTEIKSIRQGQAQIAESFVRVDGDIPVLYHAHIAEYSFGSYANHNPYRPRRLLLHKKEIRKIKQELQSGGRTLIPLRMYFKKALVKVEIAIAVGKKMHDKRNDMKDAINKRELDRAIKR
ncbi:MAG: SsrA-binding protein SmpB [Opitutales bacterium]|nr:SsrA-binding protein SmpB [Opitutales bacterium]